MGRRLVESDPARRLVDGFLGGQTRNPKKKRAPAKKLLEGAIKEVERRMDSGEWDNLRPSIFVAIHAWCHRQVYGADLILNKKEFMSACAGAKRRLDALDGDEEELRRFVKWNWKREMRRIDWRKANGKEPRIMTWQQVFIYNYSIVEYNALRRNRG